MSDRQDLDEVVRAAKANITKAKKRVATITDFQERAKVLSPEERRAVLGEIALILGIAAAVVSVFSRPVSAMLTLSGKLITHVIKKKDKNELPKTS